MRDILMFGSWQQN